MRNSNLFSGILIFLVLLFSGTGVASAAGPATSSVTVPSPGNLLGYGDKEDGYLLINTKQDFSGQEIQKQNENALSLSLPLQGESFSIVPLFQKISPTGYVDSYKSDFNLLNNGYGLEYGVGIGYTLPAAQFYGIGDMKITFNLMPKMTQGSSFLFPRSEGLSRIELGVGYRPIDNAEVFIKYLTLRDVIRQQDIFSNLADAVELGAQLAF